MKGWANGVAGLLIGVLLGLALGHFTEGATRWGFAGIVVGCALNILASAWWLRRRG